MSTALAKIENHPLGDDMCPTGLALVQPCGLARRVFVTLTGTALSALDADPDQKCSAWSEQNQYFAPIEIRVTARKVRCIRGTWGVAVMVRFREGWASARLIEQGGGFSSRLERLIAETAKYGRLSAGL